MYNPFIEKIEHPENVWLTSDLHFHHNNILKYCNRPWTTVEEMNEALINNWNSVVGPNDDVYCLGDFCFGGVEKLESIICQRRDDGSKLLNGRIHLILGNHDPERICKSEHTNEFFDEICFQKCLLINGWTVFLNHFPFLSFSNNRDHKVINLHGHIHLPNNVIFGDTGGVINSDRYKMLQWNQYDVGVDHNNYTPVSWKQVLTKIEQQKKKYEESLVG